ncbi:MAG: hypothetical protein D6676_10715 [Cyanobacteria bacterium J003]|nr:MAG: hypothetical protein D6676_10715 [Cyanobacteria bacterium J003]
MPQFFQGFPQMGVKFSTGLCAVTRVQDISGDNCRWRLGENVRSAKSLEMPILSWIVIAKMGENKD